MCFPVQCRKCGLTTWGGCGMHAEAVMARVPPDQRCNCRAGLAPAPTDNPINLVRRMKPTRTEPKPAPKPEASPTQPAQPSSSGISSLFSRKPNFPKFGRQQDLPEAPRVQSGSSIISTRQLYDYHLVVIGGGSGGLACAKAASGFGRRVACLDFVKPSSQGTTWGLGGTCVNVGCIPKRLMHQAGLLGEYRNDLAPYGWYCNHMDGKLDHRWSTLRDNVNTYIKQLNVNSEAELSINNVEYINAYGVITGPHSVQCRYGDGSTKNLSCENIVVAVGGRPDFPDIPGAVEYGISSDDIFKLPNDPGKVLVVGASYVALECAGFLTELGKDVTVAIRSVPLRGFDQQMAGIIVEYMEEVCKTKFLRNATPLKIEMSNNGPHRLDVTLKVNNQTIVNSYDNVLFAIGRRADTSQLGLEKVGIQTDDRGKIPTNDSDSTACPSIYAIGDVAKGRIELTPVAIRAGKLLAARLYGGKSTLMNYNLVPTTVFTPLEYGSCGYSEEAALESFGDDVEIYHSTVVPLEWTVTKRRDNICYVKMICLKSENERVIGFHIASPFAAEITQSVAVAMKCGATKSHFDDTVGIHPSIAEEITLLKVTKSSGREAAKAGC